MEDRKYTIKHRVLDEKTGKVNIVEEEFENNITSTATYITHKWCVDRAKASKVKDTFYTDLRDAVKVYYYENGADKTKILDIKGVHVDEHEYLYTFTKDDGTKFNVVIRL